VQQNLLLIIKTPINKKDDSLSNKGHHANPTTTINFFMDPNMYYTKYIWKYTIYHERKVSLNDHEVQQNVLLIMKTINQSSH
jgi:hypothetical protein